MLKTSSAFQQWLSQPRPDNSATSMVTNPEYPIVVVGAGPAGLAAMAALKQAGIDFIGIESHSGVGGIWDTANEVSSVYDRMNTNTSRDTTYIGPGMSKDLPVFPHHSQALAYLRNFASSQGIAEEIRFDTQFVDAQKTARNTWLVTLQDSQSTQTEEIEARAVLLATGMHNKNQINVPQTLWDEAQQAGLEVIHSCEYHRPEDYVGKRVLVVGLGQSGTDIADEISQTSPRVVLVSRSTPWIMPGTVWGTPNDQLGDGAGRWIPDWFQSLCAKLIQRVYVGHPSTLGLPAPDHRLLEKFAVTDRGFVKAVRQQRVAVRTNLVRFDANGEAVFDDAGRSETFDSVIFATGYVRSYPLLQDDGNDLSESLAFLIFHRHEPGLAYMAETIATRGCWPVFAEQGRAIAAYFAAEQKAGRNLQEFNSRRCVPSPDFKGNVYSKADDFHVEFHRYTSALRELTDWLSQ